MSGIPYPRYVRDLILDPLGMSATGFEPLDEPLLSRRAVGYSRRPFSDELDPEPAFPPVWAEGGLWSCVQDLARWIAFHLRAYTGPAADSPVLAAASLREMHKPRYLADDDWTSAWGISWCADRQDDVSTLAVFPVSPPVCASIPGSRSAPSSCTTEPALPQRLPASWL